VEVEWRMHEQAEEQKGRQLRMMVEEEVVEVVA
jgi:hypothetical protein